MNKWVLLCGFIKIYPITLLIRQLTSCPILFINRLLLSFHFQFFEDASCLGQGSIILRQNIRLVSLLCFTLISYSHCLSFFLRSCQRHKFSEPLHPQAFLIEREFCYRNREGQFLRGLPSNKYVFT